MLFKSVALKYLPPFAVSQVRAVKAQMAMRLFRPYVATHKYAGFDLTLYIADRTGRLWYDHDWEELPEHVLLRTLRLRPGAKVFDLGAHQGVVALMVSKFVGENGSVVALEPGRHNFKTALRNKQLNAAHNLTIVCAAASGHTGEISFSDGINGRIGFGAKRQAYSVDDLAKQFGVPDVVKIDVEGHELNVLNGATAMLSAKPDWYVEVHSGLGLEASGGSSQEIVDLFRHAGYRLYIQDDIHYRFPFRPLDRIPNHWFQLVATPA